MKRGIFAGVLSLALVPVLLAQVESLPAPVVHGNSFEILSNSRYSIHSGFDSTLSRQVLSNVLWAMNRVPHLGSYRDFYVATPENVYWYDSTAHALVVHMSGDLRYSPGAAFEVGIACARHEEAGFAVQAGLLAGTAFWNHDSAVVASCPMKYAALHADSFWNPAESIKIVDVFGRAVTNGLMDSLQARSSDSTLPRPRTSGPDTFEVLMSNWHQDSLFSPVSPSLNDVSQILWAGNGVTPHLTYNNRRGTTIPSADALYYLTRLIYLVREDGVWRYNNRRPPGTDLTTSDHRLELVVSGDRRPQLRSASSRIPSTAPVYVVVCALDTSRYRDMEEAGLAGFQYVTQALSLGLDGFLTVPLTPVERTQIIVALGIPSDRPALVFACGSPASAVREAGNAAGTLLAVSSVVGRSLVQIDWSLGSANSGRLRVFDLAGRPVREFVLARTTSGTGHLNWNATRESGIRLAPGVYICRLEAGGRSTAARFVLSR